MLSSGSLQEKTALDAKRVANNGPREAVYSIPMAKTGSDQPKKNPAAVALGRLRAASMTQDERSAAGKARLRKLTKAQRKAIASAAAKARWDKKKSGE
jgi:hypothetical protein